MNVTELRSLYRRYLDAAAAAERNRKPGEGLLGIGKGPADNPCHDRFAAELEALLDSIAESGPDSGVAKALLEYIYAVPRETAELKSAYWMLLAVHKLTLPLIAFLDSADAAVLLAEYEKNYPRRLRLPPQKAVLSALRKRL